MVQPRLHERIDALSDELIEARTTGKALGPPNPELIPASVAEAEAVDDAVSAKTGWPVVGWKIGCTSVHAQELLGATGPFAGRVYTRFESGASLGRDELPATPHLEGELAFTLGADLEPVHRPSTAATRTAALEAVADVRPAIEFVGGRFADFFATPLLSLIADAGANTHLVVGEPATTWAADDLASCAATMTVDGAVTGSGTLADVLDSPVNALVWLVEHLTGRGIPLEAGQIITTGTATQVSALPVGSTATNTIDGIGSVTVHRH